MYSAYKMNVTTPRNATATISQDDTSTQALTASFDRSQSCNIVTAHWYAAAGTDFTLAFFLNVPVVYLYSVEPTAT
jgi:hypothetical protein